MCTGWKKELYNSFTVNSECAICAIRDNVETVFVFRWISDSTVRSIEKWLYDGMIDYRVVKGDPPDWPTTA